MCFFYFVLIALEVEILPVRISPGSHWSAKSYKHSYSQTEVISICGFVIETVGSTKAVFIFHLFSAIVLP